MSGVDYALIFAAASVLGAIVTFGLISLSNRAAGEAQSVGQRGVDETASTLSLRGGVLTTRGDVDVDGDNVINLNGNDRRAVVKMSFVVGAPAAGLPVDLTPPYTYDSTQADPDASSLDYTATVAFRTDTAQVSSAAWSVSFPGTNDGDYILGPGEKAEITLWLHRHDTANGHYDIGAGASDPYIDTASALVLARQEFAIEVLVNGARALLILRTLPLELTASDVLE